MTGWPSNSASVAEGQLRSFVERIERVEEEIRAMNDDKKEIYSEAKGNGFDTKVLKRVIQIRRQDHAERMEQEAILDLYLAALGMQPAPAEDDGSRARAGAREIIEEFDAETGEITEPAATSSRSQVAEDAPEDGVDAPSSGATDSQQPNEGGSDENAVPDREAVNAGGRRHQQTEAQRQEPRLNETHTAPAESVADEISAPIPDTRTSIQKTMDEISARLTHNPETHFLNSKGLPRLHGCKRPEACAGTHRQRCFTCAKEWADEQGFAA